MRTDYEPYINDSNETERVKVKVSEYRQLIWDRMDYARLTETIGMIEDVLVKRAKVINSDVAYSELGLTDIAEIFRHRHPQDYREIKAQILQEKGTKNANPGRNG